MLPRKNLMEKYTRFRVNKLIRDNIPAILSKQGGYKIIMHHMENEPFIAALKEKLIEEAHEVKQAKTRNDLVEEMADVLEVFYALCSSNNVSFDEVEQTRQQKRSIKGGFDQKIYQTAFEMAESHPTYHVFKNQPDKYPEEQPL